MSEFRTVSASSKPIIAALCSSKNEYADDDEQLLQRSQTGDRARDHFLVGCFWHLLGDLSWSKVGPFDFLFLFALFVILIVSQIFWVGRIVSLGERFVPGPRRAWLIAIASVVWLFFFAYNFGPYIAPWKIPRSDSTHLTLRHVLFEAPFWWWFVGSWAGFALVLVFWTLDRAGRVAAWAYRKARMAAPGHANTSMPGAIALDPPSPARRRFVEQTAVAVSALPFVAAAYGLLYERLDVEVTRPRIALARLPKGFEGLRIVQLSDFHISPFLTADEIRRCVTIANGLKALCCRIAGDIVACQRHQVGGCAATGVSLGSR